MPTLPPISRTGSAVGTAAATDASLPSVSEWGADRVVEWLEAQATLRDKPCAPTAVRGVDGPGLLGLSRDLLSDWKVKQADQTTILRALQASHGLVQRIPRPPASIPWPRYIPSDGALLVLELRS
eukprot:scaffold3445_cov118-Isochrysis_galbana.AAC.4